MLRSANTTDVTGGVVYTLKEVGDRAIFTINGTTGVVTMLRPRPRS